MATGLRQTYQPAAGDLGRSFDLNRIQLQELVDTLKQRLEARNEQRRAMLTGDRHQSREVGDRPFHREDALGHDELAASGWDRCELAR